ncbi:hypothetical protein ACFFJT_07825 [Dyella flava]|uniref:Uncharacterized protein n=1 Tax=Dyella flava TaxID=1920170 RepID=A0ABS2K8F7_9GAMM|nr:hypothetical protein [Dyella flava]MBM7127500.1 hypothetical protein [Dyella flava]
MQTMLAACRHLRTSLRLLFVALVLHGGTTFAQSADDTLSSGLDRFSLRLVVYYRIAAQRLVLA